MLLSKIHPVGKLEGSSELSTIKKIIPPGSYFPLFTPEFLIGFIVDSQLFKKKMYMYV